MQGLSGSTLTSALPALALKTDTIASDTPLQWFRKGAEDQVAQNERNLLREVGAQAATGDMRGASETAMAGGNPKLGMDIQSWDFDRRAKFSSFLADVAQRADTPEKWTTAINLISKSVGPDMVKGYESFASRPNALTQLQAANLKFEEQRLQLARDTHNETKRWHNLQYDAKSTAIQSKDTDRQFNRAMRAFNLMESARTPEQWQAIQPQIESVFGIDMPFANRGMMLAQYRPAPGMMIGQNDPHMPDDSEMELGITREAKRLEAINKRLEGTLGKAKIGHVWALDERGEPYQKEVKSAANKGMSLEQLELMHDNLKSAFGALVGSVDAKTGKLNGDGPWMATRGLARVSGGWVSPATEEAFQSVEHAAQNIVYELSGKQVSNAEQVRFQKFYVPRPQDPPELAAFKMNELSKLYRRLMEAKKRGVSSESRASLFDSALSSQARDIEQRATGGYGTYRFDDGLGSNKAQGRVPQEKGGAQGDPQTRQRLYDKYGLER